jgi:SNF2 family DNA or RNA helicase
MKVVRVTPKLFGVQAPFFSDVLRDLAKETPGVTWHRPSRSWCGYPDAIMVLCARLQKAGTGVDIRELPKPSAVADHLSTPGFLIADKGLRDYQKFGVRFLIREMFSGAILADSMGAGKSRQVIHAFRATRMKTAIICPSYGRGVWTRPATSEFPGEVAKWWPKAMPVATLEGVRASSRIVRPTKKELALNRGLPCHRRRDDGNYDGLPRRARIAVAHYEIAYAWVEALVAWGVELLVLDEIHQSGGPRSRMWKALRWLAERCKAVVGLSGSPLQNHVRDLWNVVELVSPGRFSNPIELDRNSFYSYGLRHCGGHQSQVTPEKVVWIWDGKSHLDELKARLDYFLLRRTKSDIKLELPPKVRQVLEIEVPASARIVARAEVFKKSKEARRCLDLAANAKLPKVLDLLVLHAKQGERVVVGTHRRNIAEWLCREMLKKGVLSQVVHGGVSMRNRDKRIDSARKLRGTDRGHVLCVTMESTKSAIDLSYADVGIIVEFSWNPQTHLQWEARISRFGSTSARSLFIYVIARGTTDEIVLDHLFEKMRLYEETVGDLDEGLASDLDTAPKGLAALSALADRLRRRQEKELAR